jgi:hypothetical protein
MITQSKGYLDIVSKRSQPEAYKRRQALSSMQQGNAEDNSSLDTSKRVLLVDQLHTNAKEKKIFFDKVDSGNDDFFKFGKPGNGAPLTNEKGKPPFFRILFNYFVLMYLRKYLSRGSRHRHHVV